MKGSKREAERTMRQLIAEIEAGRAEANRSEQTLTIDQLLERWQAANVNDWSPTTARDHQRTAEGWISPHIGTVRINRLTVERLEGFYQTLLSEGGKAGRPLSAQSVKEAHSILRAALSAAVRWRLIPNNPALIAHTPRQAPPTQSARPRHGGGDHREGRPEDGHDYPPGDRHRCPPR
nr:hypothetical protein [Candidatus Microthrix sp.]